VGTYDSDDNGKNPSGNPARMKVQMRSIGADQPTVAKNPLKRWGSEEVELSCFEDVSTTAK
jgi:hypothetical protein